MLIKPTAASIKTMEVSAAPSCAPPPRKMCYNALKDRKSSEKNGGQGQSPPKTIGILTKVFCTSVPNLVILAWTGVSYDAGKLVIDTQQETPTHRRRQW